MLPGPGPAVQLQGGPAGPAWSRPKRKSDFFATDGCPKLANVRVWTFQNPWIFSIHVEFPVCIYCTRTNLFHLRRSDETNISEKRYVEKLDFKDTAFKRKLLKTSSALVQIECEGLAGSKVRHHLHCWNHR